MNEQHLEGYRKYQHFSANINKYQHTPTDINNNQQISKNVNESQQKLNELDVYTNVSCTTLVTVSHQIPAHILTVFITISQSVISTYAVSAKISIQVIYNPSLNDSLQLLDTPSE